jgi:DNA repair exonuclease SbcCD nuclease subunit
MKIAIVTDTHCGSGNDNKFLNEYFISFYETQLFPYLIDNNIKTVIHLGDTFDRRKYVNFSTLSSWRTRVFSKLNDICDRVDILIGNHDTYYKETNSVNSVVELLSGYNKFHIYENAAEVLVDKLKILYLPWICDENEAHSLSMIESTDAKVCMGHLEIGGFEMYAGRLSEGGMSASTFDKFYMTLSGHYHQKSSRGGIHYLGAPYPMMWGDYNCPRGFHILDTETLDMTFIQNNLEMFYKLYYNDSDVNYTQHALSQDFSNLTNKFVKLIVEHKTDPYLFEKVLEAIQACNPADLSLIESYIDGAQLNSLEVDQTKDTLSILNECADLINLPTSESNDISRVEKYRNDLKDKLRVAYIEALNHNEHIQSKS